MDNRRSNKTTIVIITGTIMIALIMVFGTAWTAKNANTDTNEAVRTVSSLYLNELAGRREQVVQNNLKNRINDARIAVELMDEDDLSSMEKLQAYQARMKKLYSLEKFAFVDTDGLIYTSLGTQSNINEYNFNYKTLSKPEISIFNLNSIEKKVVLAIPVDMTFEGKKLSVCFMEIDMKEMLSGVSMDSTAEDTTFCNIYTVDGIALSNTILGGLAVEDNLIEAMEIAVYDEGYSFDDFINKFKNSESGQVSFTYNGIKETLSFMPVDGTDWQLTYLIRESVISDKISTISQGIINRGIVQMIVTIGAMLMMFGVILNQIKRTTRYQLEKEVAQEELDKRIVLQKKLEEQSEALSVALKQAEEANKAKTVFLSNMSHEIRTPMNAIIGLNNIALNEQELSDKTKNYLNQIGTSADHLLNLINDILDMSRIESGHMTIKNEEFSFSKLIETINTMFSGQCQERNINYACHINSEVDDYYIGDNMKLRQVFINIIGNAVKFTGENGSIDFDIERKAHFDGKSTIEFKVKDTGIGISKEFLPHLFEPFAQEDTSNTSKYGSSGLGLAITKNIVEMMNGNIEVESEKGKGSTFTVTITLDDVTNKKDAFNEEIDLNKISALIVDDDEIACQNGKLVLGTSGIKSDLASSGKQAIEMVRKAHEENNPYNLILIDWQMPEMDGVETSKKIREIVGNESAIIILTAYKWDDVLEDALNSGVDSFVSKPLFVGNVIDEFKSVVRKRREILTDEIKVDLNGRRVLIAEDIQINAEIIEMLLKSKGIESEIAENGKIAVEMFENNPVNYYDAILMDVRMPEMDGLTATKVIRNMGKEDSLSIPIIALTANAFDEDVQRSLQAGMDAHLSKPVQPEFLFKTLQEYIKD